MDLNLISIVTTYLVMFTDAVTGKATFQRVKVPTRRDALWLISRHGSDCVVLCELGDQE